MKRVIYRTFDVKQLEQSRSPDKSAVTYKGIRFVATHRKMPDRQGGPPRVIYRGDLNPSSSDYVAIYEANK